MRGIFKAEGQTGVLIVPGNGDLTEVVDGGLWDAVMLPAKHSPTLAWTSVGLCAPMQGPARSGAQAEVPYPTRYCSQRHAVGLMTAAVIVCRQPREPRQPSTPHPVWHNHSRTSRAC